VSDLLCLRIEHDYRGRRLPVAEHALVRFGVQHAELIVDVDAPYYADPAPAAPVGSTDGLWEYEVCELFIADDAENYLEIELSPHGQHLVLELAGVRRVVRSLLPITYAATIDSFAQASAGVPGRYRGRARLPLEYLPARPSRANAYLIHGLGDSRAYHAHSPAGGERPDFHRLDSFVPIAWP
jgi:hypothetical protein